MRSLALFAFVALASAFSPRIIHERRSEHSAIASNWAQSRTTTLDKDNHVLPLRFGLKQQNIDRLHDELMRVSDPDSKHYAKHWTPDEIRDFFKPHDASVEAVKDWLVASGFDSTRIMVSKSGGWIEMSATVGEAERLLNTNYAHYTHSNGAQYIGCEYYSVPAQVSQHLDIVLPTVHFDAQPPSDKKFRTKRSPASPIPGLEAVPGVAGTIGRPGRSVAEPRVGRLGFQGQLRRARPKLDKCHQVTTLDCLRALYKFGSYKPQFKKPNAFAVVEYSPQSYLPADLDMFFTNYTPAAVGARPQLKSINGGTLQTDRQEFAYNGESDLDLEYAMGLVHPKPVGLYQVGPQEGGGSFNTFLDALDQSYCTSGGADEAFQDVPTTDCGTFKPASVISTSYAYNEADLTTAYEKRQCDEYGKLGMMGTTFLFSSGDYGVAGNRGNCIDVFGRVSPDGARFNPSFPGTCPYITSVGATQLPANATIQEPEIANWDVISSGGGFSDRFPIPSYQKKAVAKYFKDHAPSYAAYQYNNSMQSRGYPDLAANGANYVVAVNGEWGLVYGTSAATPVVGAILTLVNDARQKVGKKPVGFINPTIYSAAFKGAFNDIVNGSNPGCGTPGFDAVPGWDPVTGLGTPNFTKLVALWVELP